MHHDELHMDAIERRFVGSHGAFLLRINHPLVRSIAAFRCGQAEPETAKVVPIKRAA